MFNWLIPERFPAEMEQAYQADLRRSLFNQVRYTIMVGLIVTLLFIILDLEQSDVAPNTWKVRLILVGIAAMFVWYMDKMPEHATRWLDRVTILMGTYSSLGFIVLIFILMQGVLDNGGTADFIYLEIVLSKMLEIIYIFGPLATPLIPALLICLVNMALTLLLGDYFGVSVSLLIEAMMHMSAILFIGTLFRRQFELYSRREYANKQQAESRRQEAERIAQERIRFIRDASHNLRQPMQAIVAHNDALALELSRMAAEEQGILPTAGNLFACVNELRLSFNKIMRLSTLYDGQAAPSIGPASVAGTLQALEALYAPSASAKGISLAVRNHPANLWCDSDAGLLSAILGNLVDNAVKYTVRGKILVRAVAIKDRIIIHVVDTGIGIKEKDRDKIFKEFHRLENGLGVEGTGIGLAFVKEAVERLPGHCLRWSSREGRGTHFRLGLPAAPPCGLPSQAGIPKIADGAGGGKMILWVDDDLKVLEALVHAVSLYGFEIVKASSVTEARLALEAYCDAPDIVITDYKLLDETAGDVVRCVQNLCGPIPILVLSGEVKSGETINLLGQEFAFLQKPIQPAQLVQALLRLIG